MNKLLYLICIVVVCSCGKSNSCGSVRKDEICINFVNESDHDIKSLQIEFRGGPMELGGIKKGERRFEGFAYRDDDFYYLTVVLDNNDTLTDSTPIKAGWKITETIMNEHITSESKDFR